MEFSPANTADIEAIEGIITQCQEGLTLQGILQWDALYPSRSYFQQALVEGALFVLTEADSVRGVVVLDERQPPEWSAVKWMEAGGRSLVVHSFAVLPSAQGRGYGGAMLGYCEAFARSNGYTTMRLDAFSENAGALRFYERHGYRFQGAIELAFKPIGHRRYLCYEKLLTLP